MPRAPADIGLPKGPGDVRPQTAAPCVEPTPSREGAGWFDLFDGASLAGWRMTHVGGFFRVENGELVTAQPKGVWPSVSYLYYDGCLQEGRFRNFELKLQFFAPAKKNSGVLFHMTAFVGGGFPKDGFQIQIGNKPYHIQTGGIYGLVDFREPKVPDEKWLDLHLLVRGRSAIVRIGDRVTAAYEQPEALRPGVQPLSEGRIALESHEGEVRYRNVRLKPLP